MLKAQGRGSGCATSRMDLLIERALRPKIRAKFGGRIKAMVSGGAPLNPEVGVFFDAMGLTMLQGYGQTEAGPIISCNRPSAGIKMERSARRSPGWKCGSPRTAKFWCAANW